MEMLIWPIQLVSLQSLKFMMCLLLKIISFSIRSSSKNLGLPFRGKKKIRQPAEKGNQPGGGGGGPGPDAGKGGGPDAGKGAGPDAV